MNSAVIRIRAQPSYRRTAFEAGLVRTGFKITKMPKPTSASDWLVLWNRHGPDERDANHWERAGGTVIVAENGYIGKDKEGLQLYAISVGQHNGAGWFPVGTEDRFTPLGIPLQPWREAGEHILICGQRGIGSKLMASPMNWHVQALDRLRKMTQRPLKTRLHPGNQPPKTSLESDLENALACSIWSSGSGVKALSLGVPVLYDAPHWICAAAAVRPTSVQAPSRDDSRRDAAFHHMAHGQWSVAEIEAGEPFARIRTQLETRQ